MTRPTHWCDTCESIVYSDAAHTCYSAAELRAQYARERALTVKERAALDAAKAYTHAVESHRILRKEKGRDAARAINEIISTRLALMNAVSALESNDDA